VVFGIFGVIVAFIIFIMTRRLTAQSAAEYGSSVNEGKSTPAVHWIAFPTLTAIAIIDSATRMGFLLFLPLFSRPKARTCPQSEWR